MAVRCGYRTAQDDDAARRGAGVDQFRVADDQPERVRLHLGEGSNAALAEICAAWADLLELEVVPVVDDDVAGAVAEKVYGRSNRRAKTST